MQRHEWVGQCDTRLVESHGMASCVTAFDHHAARSIRDEIADGDRCVLLEFLGKNLLCVPRGVHGWADCVVPIRSASCVSRGYPSACLQARIALYGQVIDEVVTGSIWPQIDWLYAPANSHMVSELARDLRL